MPINFTSPGAAAADINFGAATYTTPSTSFSAGDYFLYVYHGNSANCDMATATLKGVSGTLVNEANSGASSKKTLVTLWRFPGVTSGTGTVTITCTGVSPAFGV